jgi:hypothetical protein
MGEAEEDEENRIRMKNRRIKKKYYKLLSIPTRTKQKPQLHNKLNSHSKKFLQRIQNRITKNTLQPKTGRTTNNN